VVGDTSSLHSNRPKTAADPIETRIFSGKTCLSSFKALKIKLP